MNARAFTLFTALIAFVLIVLSTILVQAMIRTERIANDTLSEIQEQSEMQSVADLARADAIQVFNFSMRRRIELFFTDESYDGYLLSAEDNQTNAGIVEDFQVTFFGNAQTSSNFASALAGELTTLLRSERTYKGYTVKLESDLAKLKEALLEVQKNSTQRGISTKKFFEIVECPAFEASNTLTDDRCPNGSFYINLDIASLDDAQYESLPQIVVESHATGRVIKEPILPRGNFRLYVPLRYFQAVAKAKKMAYDSQGLFSRKEYYDEAKLGLCDESACRPRDSPFSSVSGGEDRLCAQDSRQEGVSLQSCPNCFNGEYNPFDASKQSRELEETLEGELCRNSNTIALTDDGLQWQAGAAGGEDCRQVRKVVVSAAAYAFKTIQRDPDFSNYEVKCSEPSQIKLLMEFSEPEDAFLVNPQSGKRSFRVAIADTRYQPSPKASSRCLSEESQSVESGQSGECNPA